MRETGKQTEPSWRDQLLTLFRQRPMLLGALLVLATLLLYAPVTKNGFTQFDDFGYVTANPHVTTGLSAENIRWAFTTFYVTNWHPVTWLSHMLDCQLFGLHAGYHHLINALLHAAIVLLLFVLLHKATGELWRSIFVAALVALHPLNVENVAWISERKSLLCVLFLLLTTGAYGWYVRRPSWKRYLAIVCAFALALMSKPLAVTLPVVLLLLDYWPLERYGNRPTLRRLAALVVEKWALWLMCAASAAVTVVAARSGGAIAAASKLPLGTRVENAAISFVAYIGKTFWPAKLAIFYPYPDRFPALHVIAALAVLAAVSTAVVYFRRERFLVVGWLLFVATMMPMIGIIQVGRQGMADRYAYLPCIGIFIMIAWGLGKVSALGAGARRVAITAAISFLVAMGAVTAHYLQYWHDNVRLYSHALEVAGGRSDFAIEVALADAMLNAGQVEGAFRHYSRACESNPADALCHYKMAGILVRRYQFREALKQYWLAQKLSHNSNLKVSSLIHSAEILLSFREYSDARATLDAALQIAPTDERALALRRELLSRMGAGTNYSPPAGSPE